MHFHLWFVMEQVWPMHTGLIYWLDTQASKAKDGSRPGCPSEVERPNHAWLAIEGTTTLLLYCVVTPFWEEEKKSMCICIFHNIFYVHADLRWKKKKNNRLVVHVISSFALFFFYAPLFFSFFLSLVVIHWMSTALAQRCTAIFERNTNSSWLSTHYMRFLH